MALKYQTEIDNLQISAVCPNGVLPATGAIAYRFSYTPITHDLNFLPNVVFDRMKGLGFNYGTASANRKCSRCGASFYETRDSAVNKWNSLTEQVRENLGYTHLAVGTLDKTDGLVSTPRDGHFSFYEYIDADLTKKFKIVADL